MSEQAPSKNLSGLKPFRPSYGAGFHCIGSDCEDTCCQSWGIPLDKATYEKYRAFPPGELAELTQEYVSVEEVVSRDSLYGRINLAPTGLCPFLNTERLCNIQSSHGAEYLSATCAIYPRALNRVNGELEMALNLSCPEAARNVLMRQDSTLVEMDIAKHYAGPEQSSRVATAATCSLHKPYSYFHEVRLLLMRILRERSQPLWKRLFLVGRVCGRLDAIETEEEDQSCPEILRTFYSSLGDPGHWAEMEAIAATPEVLLDMVLRLTDQRIREGVAGVRFQECFRSFVAGVGYTPQSTVASDTFNFVSAASAYYQPFMRAHPYILENYLLNYIFRTLFPFGREASPHYSPLSILGEYFRMATQYAWMRGLLIGVAGEAKDAFSEGHVVKLVQSFSRVVEHNPDALNRITEYVDGRNLASVCGMAGLFRD